MTTAKIKALGPVVVDGAGNVTRPNLGETEVEVEEVDGRVVVEFGSFAPEADVDVYVVAVPRPA